MRRLCEKRRIRVNPNAERSSARDLIDLAEAAAGDIVDEDDRRDIVALCVEGLRRGVSDALPLSTPQCLPPFWLATGRLLVRT